MSGSYRRSTTLPLLVGACLAAPATWARAEPPQAKVTESAQAPAADGDAKAVPEAGPGWRGKVYGWIWALGIDGDVGVRGESAKVSDSFVDILDSTDSLFALSGRAEIGYGRVAGYVDAFYSDLSLDNETGPLGDADIDVDMQQSIVDFGAMYRVVGGHPSVLGEKPRNDHPLTVDLYAGGRYADIDVTLTPAVDPARTRNESWVDPVLGAKLVAPLGERWHLEVNGDVGGFGVASDFTWSATAVIGFDFHIGKLPASVLAGYRAIGWDYSTGSGDSQFTWDVIEHGLLLGLALYF